jgi:uncharacterized protein with von Willebrand factor type A (vWA) domain
MDVVGNVFSGIVKNRIERVCIDKIAEEQTGFRKDDMVLITDGAEELERITRKVKEYWRLEAVRVV